MLNVVPNSSYRTRLRARHAAADQHCENILFDAVEGGVHPHPLVLEDGMERLKTRLSCRCGLTDGIVVTYW